MFVKQAVLIRFVLLFLIFSIIPVNSIAETPQPIYKAGDYFTYKVIYTLTGQTLIIKMTCTVNYTLRIDITKIEMPIVYFNQIFKDVHADFTCLLIAPKNETYSSSTNTDRKPSIDMIPSGKGFPYLVDPSYSGEYRNSTKDPSTSAEVKISYKYNKGVLLNGIVNCDFGAQTTLLIIIELIDSSVPELKPSPPLQLYPWIIIGVVAIGAVTSLVFYLSKRRKAAPQLTPAQSPAPPQTPST